MSTYNYHSDATRREQPEHGEQKSPGHRKEFIQGLLLWGALVVLAFLVGTLVLAPMMVGAAGVRTTTYRGVASSGMATRPAAPSPARPAARAAEPDIQIVPVTHPAAAKPAAVPTHKRHHRRHRHRRRSENAAKRSEEYQSPSPVDDQGAMDSGDQRGRGDGPDRSDSGDDPGGGGDHSND